MGSNETRPGAYRHPQGDAGVETGNITRHQLILRLFGVSLRALTRVAGESPREGIGSVPGRLIDDGLRVRRCHHDARSRQNEHPGDERDTHNGDKREARGPSLGPTKRMNPYTQLHSEVFRHARAGGRWRKPRARTRGRRCPHSDAHFVRLVNYLDGRSGQTFDGDAPNLRGVFAAGHRSSNLMGRCGERQGIPPEANAGQNESQHRDDGRHHNGELGCHRAAIVVARHAH